MARVELPIVALNTTTGAPVNGASVQVKYRSSGLNATWWTQETGGTSSTAAIVTDSAGRTSAWLDRGAYNCTISGTGITTYTEPFDAAPAGDSAIDSLWLPDNVIVARHLSAAAISTVMPTGSIMPYALATAPTGFQLCNGAVGATAALLSLLDTAGRPFGGGVGAGLVPDLRGRVPVMVDGAAGRLTANDTLGAASGEETHTLTYAEIPPLPIDGATPSAAAGGQYVPSLVQKTQDWRVGTTGTGSNMVNIPGGATHNNMQPYQVVNYIIKT